MKYHISKLNLILIAVCFVIIVIGFVLMTGQPSGAEEYNPDIFSSIKYNAEYKYKMKPPIIHKRSFNSELEKLTLDKVKEIKEKEKKLISYLGPGRYNNLFNKTFNDMNKSTDKNKPPFGSSDKKLKTKIQEISPGPGQYDVNLYYNWITRTYNILFS